MMHLVKKTYLNRQKTCTLNITRCSGKKERMTHTDGKIHCALALEQAILSKRPTTKAIYKFHSVSIKLPMAFFTELNEKMLKI